MTSRPIARTEPAAYRNGCVEDVTREDNIAAENATPS